MNMIMKQIPDFLKEYETALQKYRQRSVEILATALNDGETTDIKSSKLDRKSTRLNSSH